MNIILVRAKHQNAFDKKKLFIIYNLLAKLLVLPSNLFDLLPVTRNYVYIETS